MPVGACRLLQPYFIIYIVVGPEQLPRLGALGVHITGVELS
jgi:hypothetical protein